MTTANATNRTTRAAVVYAERFGLEVIPLCVPTDDSCNCNWHNKDGPCSHPGKTPVCKWERATSDPAAAEQLFRQNPSANIGVLTGKKSGIVVLDTDPRNGGDDSLRQLIAEHGELPDTPTVLTGGGGTHHYFTYPEETHEFHKFDLAAGVEVKPDRCITVLPPSVHPSGNEYVWEASGHIAEVPLAHLPRWILTGSTNGNGKRAEQIPDRIPEGQRNNTLASLAGTMRRRGMSESAILAALEDENERRCDPPLDQAEVEAIARSVASYPPAANPPADNSSPDPVTQYHCTDAGNGQRFADMYRGKVLWYYNRGHWLVWDGMRYAVEESDTVALGMAHRVAVSIHHEAAEAAEKKEREQLSSWALRSESVGLRKAMLESAKAERGMIVSTKQLDADPWRLNVRNGTIDLRTGELHPHDPADLITKLAPVEYGETAECPLWHQFLDRISKGDTDWQRFVQKVLGYSLTGNTGERIMVIAHGTGGNGKTVVVNTQQNIMGDYGCETATQTLLVKRYEGIGNELAALAGMRFVAASEAEQGRRLAEALVKQMTGQDRISARFLYHEPMQFQPQFKLWLSTNHKPVITGTDNAIWDRIRMIPFDETIPFDERDTELTDKLKEESPGILNWAIEGCLAWQREGLGKPERVKLATANYREEMDPIGEFLAEKCTLWPNAPEPTLRSRDLYAAYLEWCKENGEAKPLSQKRMKPLLVERGVEHEGGRAAVYHGIGLKEPSNVEHRAA